MLRNIFCWKGFGPVTGPPSFPGANFQQMVIARLSLGLSFLGLRNFLKLCHDEKPWTWWLGEKGLGSLQSRLARMLHHEYDALKGYRFLGGAISFYSVSCMSNVIFNPPLLNWSLLILTVAHMTCKVVYDVFYVNLQNQKNLTPAVSKKTPEILALTNRGKDPTSRPHVTLGIRGSSQWIVTGSLIAAPMHMVKTSNWAKYLDVSGKKTCELINIVYFQLVWNFTLRGLHIFISGYGFKRSSNDILGVRTQHRSIVATAASATGPPWWQVPSVPAFRRLKPWEPNNMPRKSHWRFEWVRHRQGANSFAFSVFCFSVWG